MKSFPKILLLIMAFSFGNCNNSNGQKQPAQATAQQTPQTLLAPEAFEAISLQKDVQLVDVRTPEEYQMGHIGNASNINFKATDFKEKMSKLDKTKPVAVYCGVGGRSGKTVPILTELGFKIVYDLQGGITAWKTQGKKVN